MRESGILAGPLHGLPVSLKDSFQVEGTEATLGLVAYLGKISDTNSPLVDILLSLGAVIYVKTNIPQTLMVSEMFVFGQNTRYTLTVSPRPLIPIIISSAAC